MRSSTSSFETAADRIPSRSWMRHWAILAGLVVGLFTTAEIGLRWTGHEPPGAASLGRLLWSYHRAQVSRGKQRSIVLIGASQMQTNVDLPTCREVCPEHQVTQLAINSHGSPIAVLRDLAEDPHFSGLIVASVTAKRIDGPRWLASQQSFVDHFRGAYSWYSPLECTLQWTVSSSSCVFNYNLIEKTRRGLRGRGNWAPGWATNHCTFDRQIRQQFVDWNSASAPATATGVMRSTLNDQPVSSAFLDKLNQIETSVSRIRSRGGQVVLVRMPTHGSHWKTSQQQFPRHRWWDALADKVSSATCIHFQDVATWRRYHCPDDVHLDYRDSPAFTRDLISELKNQQAL